MVHPFVIPAKRSASRNPGIWASLTQPLPLPLKFVEDGHDNDDENTA